MKRKAASRFEIFVLLVLLAIGSAPPAAHAFAGEEVPSPEDFFGFRMGSDRKMARWDEIVDYYNLLAERSARIRVVDMGPSTMGHPFLLVVISSSRNMAQLERLREVNARLSDPRGIPGPEIRDLVDEGKAVICQSMSLHATEIGGTQMAPELAYDLLSRRDEETQRILDNVIFLLIPCFNPDGQIMVTDWYRKTLGTEYEGASLPWLYHKYAGHDNNRDGDHLNLTESKYAAKILFRDWIPQAYIDHHHMGSYGARFYVPPYCEPLRPYADPLIWREISWYGAHIAYKLEEADKPGILNAAQFPGWGHFGWHWITPFHNIAGMLTESASTKLATPIYIHPDQLEADTLAFPEYKAQTTFPHPWRGGWWKLRDIVEQKKISAWALLDLAARNRETVLHNACLKARRQTQRGGRGRPAAYVVPAAQHDPLTSVKMINKLLMSGVEIRRARRSFASRGMSYPEGSFVISLAQPKMGLIRNLLGRTRYADNAWTRDDKGAPIRPYDLATHTMNEFMGVQVDSLDEVPGGDFQTLRDAVPLAGELEGGSAEYRLDARLNDSYRAVNLLLDRGIAVQRADSSGPGFEPGDFIVTGGPEEILQEVARLTGVDFTALQTVAKEGIYAARRLRTAVYQRYWGGNMDEGWTRFLLEKFGFPYTSLMDEEIRKGGLNARYDLIILPDDTTGMIMGDIPSNYRSYLSGIPPEYRSGIGQDGVKALKAFVKRGGTLVALGDAGMFAVEKFDLSVRNAVADKDPKEFFCPGSTLKARFDNSHPLAYGMPSEGYVLFWFSPAFAIVPGHHNERCETIVRYAEKDLLRSGWLIGEKHLSQKAAMVSVQYGKGRVILIGFRAQLRCQTHGTFKLLFNALIR